MEVLESYLVSSIEDLYGICILMKTWFSATEAPKHPALNGTAENFVCTFKSTINAGITDYKHEIYTLENLEKVTDNFFFNTQHQVRHNSPQSGKTFQRKRLTSSVTVCEHLGPSIVVIIIEHLLALLFVHWAEEWLKSSI